MYQNKTEKYIKQYHANHVSFYDILARNLFIDLPDWSRSGGLVDLLTIPVFVLPEWEFVPLALSDMMAAFQDQ